MTGIGLSLIDKDYKLPELCYFYVIVAMFITYYKVFTRSVCLSVNKITLNKINALIHEIRTQHSIREYLRQV